MIDSNPPADGTLRSLTKSGKPPETRLAKASEARSVVETYIRADDQHRSWKRSRVQGLIDGNPPYLSGDQKRAGRGKECNVNWGIARSYLEAALSAFYDVFSEASTYATCTVPYGYAEGNDQAQDWAGIATEEFHCLQTEEDSFDYDMQCSQHDMVLYGSGPLMFYDTLDFRCYAVRTGNLLVPEHAKSNTHRWEIGVVRQTCLPHELFAFIRNDESAGQMGWNVPYTRKAIMAANKMTKGTGNAQNWEFHQQCLKNGSFYYSSQSNVIQIAHVFFKEFPTGEDIDGKISHKIILENGMEDTEQDFLFENVGRFKNWNECVHPMYYDHGGGGEHHSVTGMGVKLFAAMEFQNRMLCKLAMDAFVPKLLFRATTAANKQKMSIAHFGSYAMMPTDFELQQNPVSGFLQDGIGFNRELSGIVASNMSQYRQNLQKESGNPVTKGEIDWRASEQSKLGKTQLNRYYDQLDSVYQQKYWRAANPELNRSNPGGIAALEFQSRCLERGIPREVLRKMKVHATRIVGSGSMYERQQALEFLLGLISLFPEEGRQNLLDQVVASRAGQSSVRAFNPRPVKSTLPTDHEALAMLQVAAMKDGIAPVVTSSQNPVIFAQTFLKAGAEALESVQQGADPREVLAFMELIGPAARAHIQRMEADPTRKQIVETLMEQWEEMARQTDELRKLVEQQAQMQQEMQAARQQAQAIQNGTDPDTVIEKAKLDNKIRNDNIKTAAGLENKREKANQAATSAAQKLAINDMMAASKIQIQKETAKSKTNGE